MFAILFLFALLDDGTDRDRTDDLSLRRRSLYPTELQPQNIDDDF